MILFTERFNAQKLFEIWAEKYRAAKVPLNVIAWLLPVIDEDKFKDFIKDQEKELFTESKTEASAVVSKEKYDELNERYHRLLENAKILSDTVCEYEKEIEKEGINNGYF